MENTRAVLKLVLSLTVVSLALLVIFGSTYETRTPVVEDLTPTSQY